MTSNLTHQELLKVRVIDSQSCYDLWIFKKVLESWRKFLLVSYIDHSKINHILVAIALLHTYANAILWKSSIVINYHHNNGLEYINATLITDWVNFWIRLNITHWNKLTRKYYLESTLYYIRKNIRSYY